jgi:glycosyltransferase involved in cell wall biosynthesis
MKVCLGILARNEAQRIPDLISDLGKQTLLARADLQIEIHVVANGCTDNTVPVAEAAFRETGVDNYGVRFFVHDLPSGGKANAWNEFIHRLSPTDADFAFLLDGDIRIPEAFALVKVFDGLVAAPEAVVAVDRSVKDISLQPPKSIVEWMIRACTGTADDPTTAIAGALYCVRYAEARKVLMPIGLPGEDGFLRAMLLTSSFEHEERLNRHLYVPEARHIFEALRSIRAVFHHNIRLAIGTGINILIFKHFRQLRLRDVDLASYTKQRNQSDPNWINDLIRRELEKTFFAIEPKFVFRRVLPLQKVFAPRAWNRLPVRAIGVLFDGAVFVAANHRMRRGAGAGYW